MINFVAIAMLLCNDVEIIALCVLMFVRIFMNRWYWSLEISIFFLSYRYIPPWQACPILQHYSIYYAFFISLIQLDFKTRLYIWKYVPNHRETVFCQHVCRCTLLSKNNPILRLQYNKGHSLRDKTWKMSSTKSEWRLVSVSEVPS